MGKQKELPMEGDGNQHVGFRIRQIREQLNLTPADVANDLKLTTAMVSYIETKSKCSVENLIKYFEYLAEKGNVNPAFIILKDNSEVDPFLNTDESVRIAKREKDIVRLTMERLELAESLRVANKKIAALEAKARLNMKK